jgi:hypothetical protein
MINSFTLWHYFEPLKEIFKYQANHHSIITIIENY